MTCKFREITGYFHHKLRFEQVEYARHVGFRPLFSGRFIGLPTLVRVSRVDGDLTPRNFGSLADALGVRERELARSISCNTVLCGLAARLLYVNYSELCQFRDATTSGAIAMLESVDLLIGDISFEEADVLSSDDEKCLDHIQGALTTLIGRFSFGPRATLLRDKILLARQKKTTANP